MKLFKSPFWRAGRPKCWLNSLVSFSPCSIGTDSVMGELSFTVEWLGKTLCYFIFSNFLPDLGGGKVNTELWQSYGEKSQQLHKAELSHS